jgi:hypothetical protein
MPVSKGIQITTAKYIIFTYVGSDKTNKNNDNKGNIMAQAPAVKPRIG